MGKTDQDWEHFAQTDPYYAVLTEKAYHRSNFDASARERFFETGRQHIDAVFDAVRRHLDAGFNPQWALDFGCGVGRLLVPLATACRFVTGIDVSVSMLREACANLEQRRLSNVALLKSGDSLPLLAGRFDFVHSYIVLQHIPVARGERIFASLVNAVREGGIGALHVTYLRVSSFLARLSYRARSAAPIVNGVANLRRGLPFGLPMMQMNEYNLNRHLQSLHDQGCRRIHQILTLNRYPKMTIYGTMILFQKAGPTASLL
jgi:SAM-dependent methyltransferase